MSTFPILSLDISLELREHSPNSCDHDIHMLPVTGGNGTVVRSTANGYRRDNRLPVVCTGIGSMSAHHGYKVTIYLHLPWRNGAVLENITPNHLLDYLGHIHGLRFRSIYYAPTAKQVRHEWTAGWPDNVYDNEILDELRNAIPVADPQVFRPLPTPLINAIQLLSADNGLTNTILRYGRSVPGHSPI